MKTPLFFGLVTLALLWTVGEASYRSGFDAGRLGIEQRIPAEPPPPGPAYSLQAAAKEADNEVRVVILPGPKLYHSRYCRHVKNPVYIRYTRAIEAGYKPCRECGG